MLGAKGEGEEGEESLDVLVTQGMAEIDECRGSQSMLCQAKREMNCSAHRYNEGEEGKIE